MNTVLSTHSTWPSATIAKICIDRIADQILHFLTTHLCNHPPVRIRFNGTDAEIDAEINHCLTQLVNQAMNEFWNHLAEESFMYRSSRGVCKRIFYHRAPTFAGFKLPRLIADILSSIRAIWTTKPETLDCWAPILDPRFKIIVYAPDPSLSHNFGRNSNLSVVDSEAVIKCISALNAANIPMGIITRGIRTGEWGSGSFFPTCSLNQREDGTYDVLGIFPYHCYTHTDLTIAFFFDLGNPFEDISLFVGISSSESLNEFKDEMNDVMTPQKYLPRISYQSHGSLASYISLDNMKLELRDHLLTSPLTIHSRHLRYYSYFLWPSDFNTQRSQPTVIVARIWVDILHDLIFHFLLDSFSSFEPLLNQFQGTEEEVRDELVDCIKQLVNQAMNDLWNRLRNITGRHSLAARDKFFPGEAPTLEGFRPPQLIASILSSIGPLNVNLIPRGYTRTRPDREGFKHMRPEREEGFETDMWEGEDLFNITIIYAPDSSEDFYAVDVDVLQRFMRAVISSGIPVGTIDQSERSSGSSFTTCSAKDIVNGNYDVLGNFAYICKWSDAIIASLFGELGSPYCPFEDVRGFFRFGSLRSESLNLSDFQEEMDVLCSTHDASDGIKNIKSSCSTQYCLEPTRNLERKLSAEESKARLTHWLLRDCVEI